MFCKLIFVGRLIEPVYTNMAEQESDYYFDSYAHIGIHEDMLKDKIRTLSYRDAIYNNPSLFKDKVVLDVGCGTGILSMFAAEIGARKVYAIEKSDIVSYARQIVNENGFSDVITIYQGTMEEIEIPEKVDVIISEWMGYALLYESMLPSVISARDRFMKNDGTMFPNSARMFLTIIEDSDYRKSKIDFWDNVFGFDYQPIKQWALLEPLVDTVPEEKIVADDCVIADFDLNKVKAKELVVDANFSLTAFKESMVHAFVIWFDVAFDGPEQRVTLSTSPYEPSTHWSQSIFYMETPQHVEVGTVINGHIEMKPNDKNVRDQDFVITYTFDGKTYTQIFKMR